MSLKGIIFDFDGTILDTESTDYRAWQDVFSAFGHNLPLIDWMKGIGSTDMFVPEAYLETRLGYVIDRSHVVNLHDEKCIALENALPLMPGVREYLNEAKDLDLKIGLATSSPCNRIHRHLARLNIMSYFDAVKCREDVSFTKPNPELYITVLNALHLSPGEVLAFEDSPNGVIAAKAAGIQCVAIPCMMTQTLEFDADHRLNSLVDYPLNHFVKLFAQE